MATREEELGNILAGDFSARAIDARDDYDSRVEEEFDPSVSTLHINAWGIDYSHLRPYTTPFPSGGSGTGFVIEHLGENYILTAAHVAEAQHITVQFPSGDNTKYQAELICVDSSCDLALLKVNHAKFDERAAPIPISETDPKVEDDILVVGFPVGGKTLSTAKGSISRTESTIGYAHSGIKLPAAQTSAPIAPGNSGGPVVRDSELVGVAFQGLVGIDGGGQMIPVSVVKHFLRHHAIFHSVNKSSFPQLHMTTKQLSTLEKNKIGLPTDITGVKVTRIPDTSDADGLLRPGDILCYIDGNKITDDGKVMLEDGKFEPFDVLIKRKTLTDEVIFTIIRDGKSYNIPVVLRTPHGSKDLVPKLPDYEQPSFYWDSGLLFQVLTKNYSKNVFSDTRHMRNYISKLQDEEDEEVVFISAVFPKSFLTGADGEKIYNTHANTALNFRITKINGSPINSLQDVITILQNTTEKMISIEFDDEDLGELIVPKATKGENLKFMLDYNIASQCSTKHDKFMTGLTQKTLVLAQYEIDIEDLEKHDRALEDEDHRERVVDADSPGSSVSLGYTGPKFSPITIINSSEAPVPMLTQMQLASTRLKRQRSDDGAAGDCYEPSVKRRFRK